MTPDGEVFACQRCGHCCQGSGGIILTAKDLRRIAAHVRLSPQEFLAAHAERKSGRDRLRVGPDGFCVFYDHELKGCGVHPARPDVCRAWPFFAGNLLDPDSFAMAAEDCKGIRKASGHAAFRAKGLAYVRGHGLGPEPEDGDETPGALRISIVPGGSPEDGA